MSTTPQDRHAHRPGPAADDAAPPRREEAPARADRDGHRLRLPDRPGRATRRASTSCSSATRARMVVLGHSSTVAGDDRRDADADRARSRRGVVNAAARRRPPVRQLRGLRRGGDRARRSGSSRRPARDAVKLEGGGPAMVARVRAIIERGRPGDGARRADAADRRRRSAAAARRAARPQRALEVAREALALEAGRLLRDRLRGDPGRRSPPS